MMEENKPYEAPWADLRDCAKYAVAPDFYPPGRIKAWWIEMDHFMNEAKRWEQKYIELLKQYDMLTVAVGELENYIDEYCNDNTP